MDGHPSGTVEPYGTGYRVRVQDHRGRILLTRVFTGSGGTQSAQQVHSKAERFLRQESDRRRLTQNRCQLQKDGITVQMDLGGGRFVIFNQDDIERLSPYTWAAESTQRETSIRRSERTEYAVAAVSRGRRLMMHHVVLERTLKIRHVNGNGLDNRRENLENAHLRVQRRDGAPAPPVQKALYSHSTTSVHGRKRAFTSTTVVYGQSRKKARV